MTLQSISIRFESKKIAKFVIFESLAFFNAERDLTDFSASIYGRKTAVRRFETIHYILRSLSLAQSLLKGVNTPIWHKGSRAVNKAMQ